MLFQLPPRNLRWSRRIAMVAVTLASISLVATRAWADEEDTKKPASDKSAATETSDATEYAVPDGTPKELLKFIADLQGKEESVIAGIQSTARSQEDRLASLEHLKRLEEAIVKAADRVLEANPDDAVTLECAQAKFNALSLLVRTRDETAQDRLFDFAEKIAKDNRPAIADEGRYFIFQRDLQMLPQMSPEQQKDYLDELTDFILRRPADIEHFALANTVSQMLEQGSPDLAANAYAAFGEHFVKTDNDALTRAAELMQGAARRLSLVGNKMEVEGTLVGGEEFDWSAYDGKVVLVDFWATWCPPCVAELPNMLKNYEKYHDDGFEVVGISLDQDRGELERFIADKKVPWAQLYHDPGPEDGAHPMAAHYGISAIPFMVLVGKDGKVISTEARGAELNRHLKAIFAPKEDEPRDE